MPSLTPHALPRSTPEAQGIASADLLRFIDALDTQLNEIHSVMLVRHGRVVAEGWWSPNQPDHPHLMFSLSKSFTSTAVGLAIEEGVLGLDDAVIAFFPDQAPTPPTPHLAAMTVRHLLTMASGQASDAWSAMVDRADGDWVRGFFDVPVVHPPGAHFVYNTGATYLLSAIVQKATGLKLIDYLRPRLFEPLGIENPTWQDLPQGITAGGIGLSITTEGIAKFGQLYAQRGQWQGKQILPAAWVERATAPQIANAGHPNPDWAQGYGYQFWRCRHGAYRGDGVFGQYCVVLPEQDAVLAITSGLDIFDMQQPLALVWDILLPALTDAPLPDDAVAHGRLTERLAGLAHPPVQGLATSAVARHVSGAVYRFDENPLGLHAVRFDFGTDGCTLTLTTATGQDLLGCGHRAWRQGETGIFGQRTLFERARCLSSGAWVAEETYMLVVRLYETPFFQTVEAHFVGDELMLEVRVNVSLESLRPVVLTAQRA